MWGKLKRDNKSLHEKVENLLSDLSTAVEEILKLKWSINNKQPFEVGRTIIRRFTVVDCKIEGFGNAHRWVFQVFDSETKGLYWSDYSGIDAYVVADKQKRKDSRNEDKANADTEVSTGIDLKFEVPTVGNFKASEENKEK